MKYILILGLVTLATFVSGRSPCVDCGSEVRDFNLKLVSKRLKEALNKLAAGVDPHYGMDKIKSDGNLVVDGLTEKFKTDLKNENVIPKQCYVDYIYSEPQMKNDYRVTIKCAGRKPVVETYSL